MSFTVAFVEHIYSLILDFLDSLDTRKKVDVVFNTDQWLSVLSWRSSLVQWHHRHKSQSVRLLRICRLVMRFRARGSNVLESNRERACRERDRERWSDVRRAITDALDVSSTVDRLNGRSLLRPPPIKPILNDLEFAMKLKSSKFFNSQHS